MTADRDTSLDRAKKLMRLGAKALDAIVNMPSVTLYAPEKSVTVSEIKVDSIFSLRTAKHLAPGDELAMLTDGVTLFDNCGLEIEKIPAQLVSTKRIEEINSIIFAIRRELRELTEDDEDCGW